MAAGRLRGDALGMLPAFDRTARDAAYLTLGLGTSVVAFAVWVAALTLSLTLGRADRRHPGRHRLGVRDALDRRARPPQRCSGLRAAGARARIARTGASSLGRRVLAVLRDPQVWRDFAWLVVHSIVGFAFGVLALSLIGSVLGAGDAAGLVLGAAGRAGVRALERGHAAGGRGQRVPGAAAGVRDRVGAARAGEVPCLAGRGVARPPLAFAGCSLSAPWRTRWPGTGRCSRSRRAPSR